MEQKTPRELVKVYGVYAEYLGVVFQMSVVIFLGIRLGQFLDQKLGTEESTPWFTVLFCLASSALALYLIIRKALPKKK